MNKNLNYVHLGLTLLIGLYLVFHGSASSFGGVTNFDQLDAANPPSGGNAYTVSSTAAINAAGQYVGGILSSAVATFSGAVTLGSTVTLSSTSTSFNVSASKWGASTTLACSSTSGCTPTATQICQSSMITSVIGLGQTTTLPVATSLISGCLPNLGDSRIVDWYVGNATSTSFVAGGTYATGTTIYASTTAVIPGNRKATLRFENVGGSAVDVSLFAN